ncbi:MAG: SCO family protein [Myxococcota bacterium]
MTSRTQIETNEPAATRPGLRWLAAVGLVVSALAALVVWSEVATSTGNETAPLKGAEVESPAGPGSASPQLFSSPIRDPSGWRRQSDRFPNTLLLTHDERPVRFYDDLVKDRIVIVNFMYASCDNICIPIAQNLSRVHKLLGDRMGRDILILSITIDSKVDDPAALRHYIELNGGDKEGWLYLTGDYDEIDRVRRSLGVYDLDPVIDADKTEHSGLITFGNDRTDHWAALPALMDSEEIVETLLRITHESNPRVAGASS